MTSWDLPPSRYTDHLPLLPPRAAHAIQSCPDVPEDIRALLTLLDIQCSLLFQGADRPRPKPWPFRLLQRPPREPPVYYCLTRSWMDYCTEAHFIGGSEDEWREFIKLFVERYPRERP